MGDSHGQPREAAAQRPTEALLEALQDRLGYHFTSRQLLLDALTHRSYAYEHAGPGVVSNERLEFLGDAVLQLVSSDLLFRRYPQAPEGELTSLRAALVRGSTLAEFARGLELGGCLRLGRGEEANAGRERMPINAAAFEALLGAMYLDGGMEAARRFVVPLLVASMERLHGGKRIKDDKSRLQELAQARLSVTPRYRVVEESGPSHERTFVVEVLLGDTVAARGEGRSKRQAEQVAAQRALADEGWAGGAE
jgi:ribonuclease-3